MFERAGRMGHRDDRGDVGARRIRAAHAGVDCRLGTLSRRDGAADRAASWARAIGFSALRLRGRRPEPHGAHCIGRRSRHRADRRPSTRPASAIEVPDAMVHHWRGAVLIPGIRLAICMTRLAARSAGHAGAGRHPRLARARARPRSNDGVPQAAAHEDRDRRLQHRARRALQAPRRGPRVEHQHGDEDRRDRESRRRRQNASCRPATTAASCGGGTGTGATRKCPAASSPNASP